MDELPAEKREAYAERLARWATQHHDVASFRGDPVLQKEPFLAERAYMIHAQHHGLDEHQIQLDLLAAQLGGLGPNELERPPFELEELEREDMARLRAAALHAERGELDVPLEAPQREDVPFELDVASFDPRLFEARDALSRSVRDLAHAACHLHYSPEAWALAAFERHCEDYRRAADALRRQASGVRLPQDFSLHVEAIEANAQRAIESAALGEALARARALDRLARAYVQAPDPSLYRQYLDQERNYRRVVRWLERQDIRTDTEFAGGPPPVQVAAEARRLMANARALDFARRSEAAARRFKDSLESEHLVSYERFEKRARALLDRHYDVPGYEPLPTEIRLRTAQARDHLERAQSLAELREPPRAESLAENSEQLPTPAPRELEVELYKAVKDLREELDRLRPEPSPEELQRLDDLRGRCQKIERDLGIDPNSLAAAQIRRLRELRPLEIPNEIPKEHRAQNIQRRLELHAELRELEAGRPPAGWQSDLGRRAHENHLHVQLELAAIDLQRHAKDMDRASKQFFEEPSLQNYYEFHQARGAFERCQKQYRIPRFQRQRAAMKLANEAEIRVVGARVRRASESLGHLADRQQAPSLETFQEARRALRKPLRELLSVGEQYDLRQLEEKVTTAYFRLRGATYRLKDLPNPAALREIRAARRGISELYDRVHDFERRALRERLPELAGPFEAARAAEAELARQRAHELSAEIASKLQDLRSSEHLQGPLDRREIYEPLRELERLELRYHSALGEELHPLRERVEKAELRLAIDRLETVRQIRDSGRGLTPEFPHRLAAAESHFLRAAAAQPEMAEPWRQHFEAKLEDRLDKSLDQFLRAVQQTGGRHGERLDAVRVAVSQIARDLASHQRFHHNLPKLPAELDRRGLRPVAASLEYIQKRIRRAAETGEPIHVSPRLAEFLRDPQAFAAQAADQHWADRMALQGHSFQTIRDTLRERAAHPLAPRMLGRPHYFEQVAARAVSLARRVRPPMLRALQVAQRGLPPELRVIARGVGLLTPKATPIALASFLYAVAKSVQRQMARAKEQGREGGRGRSR